MAQLHGVAQYSCKGTTDTCEVIVDLPEKAGESSLNTSARFKNEAQRIPFISQCPTTCESPQFVSFVGYGDVIAPEDKSNPPFDCDKKNIATDDGDTFECNGNTVRVLGFDTAEIEHPGVGICEDQDPAGRLAARMLESALEAAVKITVVPSAKPDKYSRILGYLLLDEKLYGPNVLRQGLAYQTIRRYGTNGLPEYAQQILDAARAAKKPSFQDPHDWRKTHQHPGEPCPISNK